MNDRTRYTGADAKKLFSQMQQKSQAAAPPGIYLNSTGDIMWNTAKKGDSKANVYLIDNGKSTLLGNLGGTINIDQIYQNLLEQNIAIAKGILDPRLFRDFVNYGGIWDYKSRYSQSGRLNTIFGYVNLVNLNKTNFSFRGQKMDSQDIGNHHYGVVGLATGLFSEETLLRAAGDAQIKNKTSNPAWIKWELVETIGDGGVYSRMLPPYGDDPRDQYWITEGYKYLKTRFP